MVHEWPTAQEPRRLPSDVRLSRAQRLDVAGMLAAGIVSAGLFLTPILMLPRSAASAEAPAPAAAAPAQPPRVTVSSKAVTVPVSKPLLRTVAEPRVLRADRSAPPPAVRHAAATPRKSDAPHRRLARLIMGDGRHSVRPFPTVGNH